VTREAGRSSGRTKSSRAAERRHQDRRGRTIDFASASQRLRRIRSLSRRGAAPPGSERPYDRFFLGLSEDARAAQRLQPNQANNGRFSGISSVTLWCRPPARSASGRTRGTCSTLRARRSTARGSCASATPKVPAPTRSRTRSEPRRTAGRGARFPSCGDQSPAGPRGFRRAAKRPNERHRCAIPASTRPKQGRQARPERPGSALQMSTAGRAPRSHLLGCPMPVSMKLLR